MRLDTTIIDGVIWVVDEAGRLVGTLLRPEDRAALHGGEDVFLDRRGGRRASRPIPRPPARPRVA